MKNGISRGVSKREWIKEGLRAVHKRGVAGLTVERLAKSLGIARAGFYWHFSDRDDLLRQILSYWAQELTEIVTNNVEVLALDPKSRLAKTAEIVVGLELASYDMAIRQWALEDRQAMRMVGQVDRIRLDFTQDALRELGFSRDDLEIRAKLFLSYLTWEKLTFRRLSRKRRRELVLKAVDLVTSK